jgi:hypothetical protein
MGSLTTSSGVFCRQIQRQMGDAGLTGIAVFTAARGLPGAALAEG